jgi:hypothetical protein
MHADQEVTIEVKPGTYIGPITIDRPNTKLIALSDRSLTATAT